MAETGAAGEIVTNRGFPEGALDRRPFASAGGPRNDRDAGWETPVTALAGSGHPVGLRLGLHVGGSRGPRPCWDEGSWPPPRHGGRGPAGPRRAGRRGLESRPGRGENDPGRPSPGRGSRAGVRGPSTGRATAKLRPHGARFLFQVRSERPFRIFSWRGPERHRTSGAGSGRVGRPAWRQGGAWGPGARARKGSLLVAARRARGTRLCNPAQDLFRAREGGAAPTYLRISFATISWDGQGQVGAG